MIRNGIDCICFHKDLFYGKRLGMVTSSTATALDRRPSYIVFHEQFPLRFLFSPEHGLHARFANGEQVSEDPVDPVTGAAVVSLFGDWTAKPIPSRILDQLDAVVYDIQDLGTRFYTFITTMIQAMKDCATAGKEFIILDRPALLGGETVEGGLLDPAYKSFIGPYSLPVRYGLTAGELARMVNDEQKLGCRLRIVPCRGWKRSQLFSDPELPWVNPSSAISDFETALLYPGMCLFEGTNLSEGRGTGRPFRLTGAPFVDGALLSREMNALALPGVSFEPLTFTPVSSKYRGIVCQGVHLHITDPAAFLSVRTGISLLFKILEHWKDHVHFPPAAWSDTPMISYLTGCDALEGTIPPLDRLLEQWDQESEAFRQRKTRYHIYD